VAVIVPDADIAKQWASENGVAEEGQMAALCGNAKFKAAVMAQMKSAGSSAALKGFEVVRDIHLEAELFSVDNDLLTPTFKLKRPQVCALPSVQHAATSLDHVYAYTELSSHGLSLRPSPGQSQVPEADCGNVPPTQRGRSSQAPNCRCDVSVTALFSLCSTTYNQSLRLTRVNLLFLLSIMLLTKQLGSQ
jgi:hypothetical protein